MKLPAATLNRIGKPPIVREGNGFRLTSFAVQTMKQYKRLQRLVERESDKSYNDLMSNGLAKK